MEVWVAKILSSTLIGLSGLLGCLIPYLVIYFSRSSDDVKAKQDAIDSRLCLCNCLGAGIIMGMAYLHILPEAVEQCEHGGVLWKIGRGVLNPAYFIALMAFCAMLFMERVLSPGRTPCSAAFNSCQAPESCCGFDEESASCCESASRSAACDLERAEAACVIDVENPAPGTVGGIRSRFQHRHLRLMARLMQILCPLCECNGLCITLALFIHSLFEGLVIGLVDSHWSLWMMTVGIVLHKWAAGMALSSFVSSNKKVAAITMQSIFCLGSPLGILIGGLTAGRSASAEAVLNCLATGTLIYIGMEVVTHELFCHMHCRKTAFWKWLCVMGGVSLSGGCPHTHVPENVAQHAREQVTDHVTDHVTEQCHGHCHGH
ncbi:Zn2+ or Fe2+ permease [Babesia caballi]|uniref:Zn2+ or Fe2+ permease n=1 Tax=Babesia caballi TaxID=5871 RepID=A0AAV4LP30_BABCB|nr:Zn2+ or Fe2+ permease [Babesia caballi]